MRNTSWFKITWLGMALVAAGVGTYVLLSSLSAQTLGLLAGAAAVLTVVVIVGLLFVVNNALQGRILRRQLAQDNLDDLKQLAMVFKLLGNGRAPHVNVKVPEPQPNQVWPFFLPGAGQAQLPEPQQPWPPMTLGGRPYDGVYRDTTFDGDVELE